MSDTRVRVGGAVQYVADLPAAGNDVGDRRVVLEPPAGAQSTVYRWDGAAWVPENEPLSGTLRLYVDGTNGDDTAQGTSWGEAWKTYAKLERELGSILAPNPTDLTTIVYVRGDFTGQDLTLVGSLHGASNLYVVHHIDDWTEVASGTVATVAATTFAHTMREMTFNGIALAAAHEGRALVLEDGAGQRVTYQILRVWDNGGTMTATVNRTSVAAWIGAGTLASIRQPSVVGDGVLNYDVSSDHQGSGFLDVGPGILGLRFGQSFVAGSVGSSSNLCLWIEAALAFNGLQGRPAGLVRTSFELSYSAGLGYYIPLDVCREVGIVGTNTDNCGPGSVIAGTGNAVQNYGGRIDCKGVFKKGIFQTSAGYIAATFCSVEDGGIGAELEGAMAYAGRAILGRKCTVPATTVPVKAWKNGTVEVSCTSFLDLNAAGCGSGFFSAYFSGFVIIPSTVDGNNTGTAGSGLVVANCVNGEILFSGNPSVNLKGEHGFLNQTDGRVRLQGNYSQGALEGGGPDIYVEKGTLTITGTVTKTATNPSGGGVAQPVLKCRRGAKVTMDAADAFTLPAGSGNNATDYGANGAIDIETCCDVALGTLAGGAAGAVGIAARVKRASRLAHAGAGAPWGGTPLDLGGSGAIAWPAANPTSDAAAGVPEDCWVLPGSA
ncbi:MAG: hypothetical protein JXB32_24740 [Deltaproteobacteria bacterium]|nr:hypothetical protein [Deltaproteobacteria bacterium]